MFKLNSHKDIEELLENISFDNYYIEATFQFKLLMQLASIVDESNIFPERNIRKYFSETDNFHKKEIDIVIEDKSILPIAIELKMPMNGQTPAQMYEFVSDINFLEKLKNSGKFSQGYLCVVTNDKGFMKGPKLEGIYSYFRNNKTLEGTITKPTRSRNKNPFFELTGRYNAEWKTLKNEFIYFIIGV